MDESPESILDRRRFLWLVGLAGLGLAAPAPRARAQSGAPGSAAPTPAPAAPAPEPISDDAQAIAGVLRRRYSTHPLDDGQWTSIQRDIDGDLAAGKRLRSAKLVNADEPDVTFHA